MEKQLNTMRAQKDHLDNLWENNNVNSNKKEWFDYPTQKPENLIERIIKFIGRRRFNCRLFLWFRNYFKCC